MSEEKLLYDYAMQLVALPYRWGGDDTLEGFDCSGLCIELLRAGGVLPGNVDMNAHGLFHYPAFQYAGEADFGVLAFYGKEKQRPTHVGFCLDGRFMLEAGGGGSATTSLAAAAKQNAYVRVRPVSHRTDFIGYRRAL
jgi:cell wall-associated NlpC family hydrolase